MFNNVYKGTGIYYFAVPHEVFASGLWGKLSAPAKALYPWLHSLLWDEAGGARSVMLTHEQITAGTGLSVNSVSKARKDLEDRRLIRSTRQKYGYIFEPLNPLNGQRIEVIEDFNKLDPEWIEAYFAHHASEWGMFEDKDQPGVLRAHCPFHDSKDRTRTLMMNTADGGYWKCIDTKQCGRKGKLVHFEMALWERRGSTITPTQARSNVMSIMHSAKRDRMQAEAEEERIEAERIALIGP